MKKNLGKKALLPAIAMVLASVIALSGVTYAWFTTGNTAEVTALDVNVATASGIQVSLDASAWKSKLTQQDFINAIKSKLVTLQYPMGDAEIAPMSSAGTVVDGKLQMYFGKVNKDASLTSQQQVEENSDSKGNFVAFDLYIKASESGQVLTMNKGTGMSSVEGIDLAVVDPDTKDFVKTSIGTEKAVRVAFVVMNGAKSSAAEARSNTSVKDIVIWEPNSTSRANGVPEDITETDGVKLDYLGFKSAFEDIAVDNLSDTDEDGNPLYAVKVATEDKDLELITLSKGINKIRVYIWLEGQDVDCVNDISFGDFRVNLYFSVPGDETVEESTEAPSEG